LSASHQRCDRGGSNAPAAVSHTVNGNQMRSVSALLSMDRSAHRIASSAPSTTRRRPGRRLIAATSNARPIPATLPNPIAHTTDAKFPHDQY